MEVCILISTCNSSNHSILFFRQNKVIMGLEPLEHAQRLYKRTRFICNALIISPKKHPFVTAVMDEMIQHYDTKNGDTFSLTGPMFYTRLYEQILGLFTQVILEPPCTFYPLTDGLTNRTIDGHKHVSNFCKDLNNTYCIHYWATTWDEKKQLVKNLNFITFWYRELEVGWKWLWIGIVNPIQFTRCIDSIIICCTPKINTFCAIAVHFFSEK